MLLFVCLFAYLLVYLYVLITQRKIFIVNEAFNYSVHKGRYTTDNYSMNKLATKKPFKKRNKTISRHDRWHKIITTVGKNVTLIFDVVKKQQANWQVIMLYQLLFTRQEASMLEGIA